MIVRCTRGHPSAREASGYESGELMGPARSIFRAYGLSEINSCEAVRRLSRSAAKNGTRAGDELWRHVRSFKDNGTMETCQNLRLHP